MSEMSHFMTDSKSTTHRLAEQNDTGEMKKRKRKEQKNKDILLLARADVRSR